MKEDSELVKDAKEYKSEALPQRDLLTQVRARLGNMRHNACYVATIAAVKELGDQAKFYDGYAIAIGDVEVLIDGLLKGGDLSGNTEQSES